MSASSSKRLLVDAGENPRMCLSCPKRMVRGEADVKPESTGCKSRRVTKPILKSPMNNFSTPDQNVAMMAIDFASRLEAA